MTYKPFTLLYIVHSTSGSESRKLKYHHLKLSVQVKTKSVPLTSALQVFTSIDMEPLNNGLYKNAVDNGVEPTCRKESPENVLQQRTRQGPGTVEVIQRFAQRVGQLINGRKLAIPLQVYRYNKMQVGKPYGDGALQPGIFSGQGFHGTRCCCLYR